MDNTEPTPFNYTVTFYHNEDDMNKVMGHAIKMEPTTLVAEIYHPYNTFTEDAMINSIEVRSEDETFYNGRGMITSIVSTNMSYIVTTKLLDSWQASDYEDYETLSYKFEEAIQAKEKEANAIDDEYRIAVGKMKQFFEITTLWLEQAELRQKINNNFNQELWDKAVNTHVQNDFNKFALQLEKTSEKLKKYELDAHKKFSQQELLPFILNSPFAHRCYFKPLGYPGDYDMVNMIWRNMPEGNKPLSKVIHNAEVGHLPALAHRNRIMWLEKNIAEIAEQAQKDSKQCHILNIACGPAIEIQEFVKNNADYSHCSFHLLDFSEETLDYAKNQITKAAGKNKQSPDVRLIRKSVRDFLNNPSSEGLSDVEYDLIYCAGLFDYLSDRMCTQLIKLFFSLVKPGGLILTTNVHADNPTKCYMEYILEWNLIYRDERAFLQLANNIGESELVTDHTGINLLLETHKPKPVK